MVDQDIQDYLHQQTIIAGEVNSGKTLQTTTILELFLQSGYGSKIALLDLAPDPIHGIGGKLKTASNTGLLYLTDTIAAPRLMGKNANHTMELAKKNARTIEALFDRFERSPRDIEILFVNDVTLYLQAGSLNRFQSLIKQTPTSIINAYYGSALGDSELSKQERQATEALMATCDKVILL